MIYASYQSFFRKVFAGMRLFVCLCWRAKHNGTEGWEDNQNLSSWSFIKRRLSQQADLNSESSGTITIIRWSRLKVFEMLKIRHVIRGWEHILQGLFCLHAIFHFYIKNRKKSGVVLVYEWLCRCWDRMDGRMKDGHSVYA